MTSKFNRLTKDILENRYLSVASIFTIIGVVAFYRITSSDYSMWFDEFASLFFAGRPHEQLWSEWIFRETNYPLFYSMVRVWHDFGAITVVELRYLPISASIIGLFIAAFYCWRYYGAAAAVAVVILCGFSAQHLYYSHLLRSYMIGYVGVLLSLFGLTILLKERRFLVGASFYIVGASLAIHSHPTFFLWPIAGSIAAVAVFFDWQKWNDFEPIKWLTVVNVVLLFIGSWSIYLTLHQIETASNNISWIVAKDPRSIARLLIDNLLLFREPQWLDKQLLRGMFGLSVVVATVLTWRSVVTRLCTFATIVAVLLFVACEAFRPIMATATVFWISIFPTIVIAGAIGTLARPVWRWGWLAVLAFGLVYNTLDFRARLLPVEGWSQSLRSVASDPRGILLVEHESMALAAREACLVEFPDDDHCPVDIRALRSTDVLDSWALGQFDGKVFEGPDLAAELPIDAQIYAFRHFVMDPLGMIGVTPRNKSFATPAGELSGPYPASEISRALSRSGQMSASSRLPSDQ